MVAGRKSHESEPGLQPDLSRPELRPGKLDDTVYAIPPKPLTNEHGFMLVPVVQGQQPKSACLVCNTRCGPNSHHVCWPKPARKAETKAARSTDPRFRNVADFGKDPYKQLRNAPFSISGPVCSRWHHALHNVQEPPTDLPDRDIIYAAVDQYDRLDRATKYTASLAPVITGRLPIGELTRREAAAAALYIDLPPSNAILFPTVGYTCTVGLDGYFSREVPVFDIKSVHEGLALAIRRIQRRLS